VQGVEAWRVACHEGGGEGRGVPPDTANSTRLLLCPGPAAQGGACAGLQGPSSPWGSTKWLGRRCMVAEACLCAPHVRLYAWRPVLFQSRHGDTRPQHAGTHRSPIPVRRASCTGWEVVCGMVICRSVG
jgi:hypothetical protein